MVRNIYINVVYTIKNRKRQKHHNNYVDRKKRSMELKEQKFNAPISAAITFCPARITVVGSRIARAPSINRIAVITDSEGQSRIALLIIRMFCRKKQR